MALPGQHDAPRAVDEVPADQRLAAETRAFLTERGVNLTSEQATKTKRALEFFAKKLQAERAAA